jgi:uncharacterized repeat protein (TIGR01451 family)/fimbrial isopeptide formation D2 family protein
MGAFAMLRGRARAGSVVAVAAGLAAVVGTGSAQASAAQAPAPGMTCPAVDVWGYDAIAGEIVEFTPNGALVGSAPAARPYGDIAWSADGTTLYGVEFNTPDAKLYTIDPVTGAETAEVAITGIDPLASGAFNGLSTLPDGRLIAQSARSQGFFALDPASGVATQIPGWLPGADVGAGDGVQLPDGDFLVLGTPDFVRVDAYRLHPDHTVTRIGRLPMTAFGVALSGGQSYFFGGDGSIRSLATVPTAPSSDPLDLTIVKAPDAGAGYWGASSIQDSGRCNLDSSMSYSVSKTAAPAGQVVPGTVVTYTVTVANTGARAYPETTAGIADDMSGVLDDAAVVPGSATATTGRVTVSGDRLSWIGPLAAAGDPGSTVTVTYQVRVGDGRTGDGVLVNSVAPTGAGGACASAAACASRVTVLAPPAPPAGRSPAQQPQARLRLSKTPDRRVLSPGDLVWYSITVRNPSAGAARDVRVCDQLAEDFAYVRAHPRARLSEGRYCWTVRRLGPKASRTFRVQTRALRDARGRRPSGATATSRDAPTARARTAVRVIGERAGKGGGVTG